MFVIRDRNTGEYAYYGEGWAFTKDPRMAKRFSSYDEAYAARAAILATGEFLLVVDNADEDIDPIPAGD